MSIAATASAAVECMNLNNFPTFAVENRHEPMCPKEHDEENNVAEEENDTGDPERKEHTFT